MPATLPQDSSVDRDYEAAVISPSFRAALEPRSTSLCSTPERRRQERRPFPKLLHLVPVGVHGTTPVGPPITVVGKDLSEDGIGFFHPWPIPFRRAIVAFDDGAGRSVNLLMDLSWCQFTRFGWYMSGGRFLQVVDGIDEQGPSVAPGSLLEGESG